LRRLLANLDNIRAAWGWLVAQRDLNRLNLALRGLARLCSIQSWNEEAVARFRAASALGHIPATAHLQIYESWFIANLGDVKRALAMQTAVLQQTENITDPMFKIELHLFHGLTLMLTAQYKLCDHTMQRVLQLARVLGNRWFEGIAHHGLAYGRFMQMGETDQTFAEMMHAATLFRAEGDIFQAMYEWHDACRIAITAQRFADAERLLADCEPVSAQLGNPLVAAQLELLRGRLALAQGYDAQAHIHLTRSLTQFQALRASAQIAEVQGLLRAQAENLTRTGQRMGQRMGNE